MVAFFFLLVLVSFSVMVVFSLLLVVVVFRFLLARVQCVPGQRRRRQHNHRASSSSLSSPHSRFGHKQSVKHLGRTAIGDAVLGDARATVLSLRGASEDEVGSECGAVLAVEGARPTRPERGVLGQEETSACGEGASASGETSQAQSGAGKSQGASVPGGRRAERDRGARESERRPCRQLLDEGWASGN